MKDILAVGDSLIAGDYGASLLEHSKYRLRIKNGGANGEPVRGIIRNLKIHLNTEYAPDILILDGGANDILIPYIKEHHPKEWGPLFRKLFRHGSIPAESEEEFRELILAALRSAFEAGVSTVVFLTIPCLGEDPAHPLNRKRERMNNIIREIHSSFTGRGELLLADLGRTFDTKLGDLESHSPWIFSSPADLENTFTPVQIRERNLVYTIDGVHLNTEGAEISAEVLDDVLMNIPI